MGATAKTYDPKQISIVFGLPILGGFADGTFVKVTRRTDTFSTVVGADGESARVRSRDRSGEIELTLMATSAANTYLAALAKSDEEYGLGVRPFTLRDVTGEVRVSAATAWVKKPADAEFGKELSTRTWVLETGELEIFPGRSGSA